MKVQSSSDTTSNSRLRRGKGEQSAIALAKELSLPILVDDRKARIIARKEGLLVSGTLGVLQQAHVRGLDLIADSLTDLAKTNYYLSDKLVEQVVNEAQTMRESFLKRSA